MHRVKGIRSWRGLDGQVDYDSDGEVANDGFEPGQAEEEVAGANKKVDEAVKKEWNLEESERGK